MATRKKSQKKPTMIEYEWYDPWTNEFCAGAKLKYTRQRMANGFYRRHILSMKVLAKQWTGQRTPKLRLTVHRAR